jgi:hypothetical protein
VVLRNAGMDAFTDALYPKLVDVGDLNMSDNKRGEEVDVTKEWRATHGQQSAATRLRIFAAIAWIIAIGTEIAGVVMLRQH